MSASDDGKAAYLHLAERRQRRRAMVLADGDVVTDCTRRCVGENVTGGTGVTRDTPDVSLTVRGPMNL